jgi:DNA-binding MarR family transcriptional regulator
MKNAPSQTMIRAWARLMRAQHVALSQIETALKGAGLPTLAWYDALLELERADGKSLRPFELERALLVPQYGLSRLLDRLEAAGDVERRPCDDDGRGQIVAVTKAGRQKRRAMWPVYAGAIHRAMATRLSEEDAAALDSLLGKLIGAPTQ